MRSEECDRVWWLVIVDTAHRFGCEVRRNQMQITQAEIARIKGRVPVTLYLDETLAKWGELQEGGLSGLVQNLLLEAQQRAPATELHSRVIEDRYSKELRETYQSLIDRKLESGLTPEEEIELAETRAEINRIDQASPQWQVYEQAASVIDRELADLRREIEALPEKR